MAVITREAYERGEFSQAQEESGAEFVDALNALAFVFGLGDDFMSEVADAVDGLTVKHLPTETTE